MSNYETTDREERVILACIDDGKSVMDAESCLNELGLLAQTSGALVVGRIVQKREAMHPGHYLGKGKLDELKDLVSLTEATGVICDDELTGTQLKNIEQALDIKVMDRTMVILDIFALCAHSAEGKAQVELAQLNYRVSRLTGLGKQLSRLGGGIGTRGPGEKKLETDRRHIRRRIAELNEELREIEKQRGVLRERREKSNIGIVSMVGYTNAGKSSIMYMLTNAGVFADSRLFATLETTTRKLELPGGRIVLFTDTVGFIQKLPHHLVKAFRATLEELKFADILVHVVDASNPNRNEQMEVVYKTLKELGCIGKPIITVYNKCDLEPSAEGFLDPAAERVMAVSAKTRKGSENLLLSIEQILQKTSKRVKLLIPYRESSLLNLIYGKTEIFTEDHSEEGTYLDVLLSAELSQKLAKYIQTM